MAKASDILNQGINLMVIDFFTPAPREPHGIHKPIWDEFGDEPFDAPPGKPVIERLKLGHL